MYSPIQHLWLSWQVVWHQKKSCWRICTSAMEGWNWSWWTNRCESFNSEAIIAKIWKYEYDFVGNVIEIFKLIITFSYKWIEEISVEFEDMKVSLIIPYTPFFSQLMMIINYKPWFQFCMILNNEETNKLKNDW